LQSDLSRRAISAGFNPIYDAYLEVDTHEILVIYSTIAWLNDHL